MGETARLHSLVDAVDWAVWPGAHGPAVGLGGDVHAWLDGRSLMDSDVRLLDVAFHQGCIYPVAEPLAGIFVAALAADRWDLHADAIVGVQAAVCGYGAQPHEADGFDEWQHPWPGALRVVAEGIEPLLVAVDAVDDTDAVALGLSALAWMPARSELIGAWLAARLERDPARLAPLLAVVDWHRWHAGHAGRFASLRDGEGAIALAGAMALARVRRTAPAVSRILLEGIEARDPGVGHALDVCRGHAEDVWSAVVDAYLVGAFPSGGPRASVLDADERRALARLLDAVPHPAEPAGPPQGSAEASRPSAGRDDDAAAEADAWLTDPDWPEQTLEAYGLPATRRGCREAVDARRAVHPLVTRVDPDGRLHVAGRAGRGRVVACPVGHERMGVVLGRGEVAVIVVSLADGSERGRLARPPGGGPWWARLVASPDGRRIAGTASNMVAVWSVDGTDVRRFVYRGEYEGKPASTVPTAAWSPDGAHLAIAHMEQLEVYRTADWTPLIAGPTRLRPGILGWARGVLVVGGRRGVYGYDEGFTTPPVRIMDGKTLGAAAPSVSVHGAPVVARSSRDGVEGATQRGPGWVTWTVAVAGRVSAIALAADGTRMAVTAVDAQGVTTLLVWRLSEGAPIGPARPVLVLPCAAQQRLVGHSHPWMDRLGWHPCGWMVWLERGEEVVMIDVPGGRVLVTVRVVDGHVVWEAPHEDRPANLSAVTGAHVVLQTHTHARPSQVRDQAGEATYWAGVVDSTEVFGRLEGLFMA